MVILDVSAFYPCDSYASFFIKKVSTLFHFRRRRKMRSLKRNHSRLQNAYRKPPKYVERELFKFSKFQCGGTKKEEVYKKL